ncbi:hypothetical protein ABZP36_032910 [Zizania latifolia]
MIIDAKPWRLGGDTREIWDGSDLVDYNAAPSKIQESNSDRAWRMLSKPLKKGHSEYIPNITFGTEEEPITMKRFGSFCFKSGRSGNQVGESPVLKTLVLVSTRSICDEEHFLNYRYSNSKK